MAREPHKFDPAKAGTLDNPERERILPKKRIVELLDLRGLETVVDYGAGSGRLSVPVARSLTSGTLHAVDESPEMLERLRESLAGVGLLNVRTHLIQDNEVPLQTGSVDRVLAVNLLHEVIGETALQEMRRLLRPEGFLLVIDWSADVTRDQGPPAEVSLSAAQGREMLEEAGFETQGVGEKDFPLHFAFVARPRR